MRKFLAILLIIVFGVVAIPAFLNFALSRTLLNTDFYQKEALSPTYSFLVNATVDRLLKDNELLAAKFTKKDLVETVEEIYTQKMFSNLMSEFTTQLTDFQNKKIETIDVSLLKFRQSLLTLANTLSYRIYQDLPSCPAGTLPVKKMPECVPEGVAYEKLIGPIKTEIELSIYNSVPENFSGLENVIPVDLFNQVKFWEVVQLSIMLGLMALIALLIYQPWTTFFAYLSAAFGFGGVLGASMAFMFEYLLKQLGQQTILSKLGIEGQKLIFSLTNYTANEVLRLSIVFLVMAMALMLLSILLKSLTRKNVINQ